MTETAGTAAPAADPSAPSPTRPVRSAFVQRLLSLRPRNPAQLVVVAFAIGVLVVTALLMLPVASETRTPTSFRVALFTATSAVCVTGLTVVDTPTHWSTFGEVVIAAGVQLGGFGFMTVASLLGLLVFRRLGLRNRLVAQTETKSVGLGDVRQVLRGVAITAAVVETATALILGLRLWQGYGEPPGRAAYLGVFHSVTAFNNAGFGLYSDNLIRFVTDPWVTLPIAGAVILGGIGYPVLFELRRERKPVRWSLHTKTTLLTYGLLMLAGTVLITASEWANERTFGPLTLPGKLLAGFFHAVMPRTAGFNAIDYGAANETTLLITDGLMFIGGGSGSTAGGIKVTTFMLLFYAILSEARGDDTVDAFGRRVPPPVLRQALSVALLGVAVVVAGTVLLLAITGLDLDRVLFEAVSAFATVGLSTGITAGLPPAAQYVLVALMFIGRTGSVTLASALALRHRRRLYRLPEERPIVG